MQREPSVGAAAVLFSNQGCNHKHRRGSRPMRRPFRQSHRGDGSVESGGRL